MSDPQWDHLIVEQRTAPPLLDAERFRSWMLGRPNFVSSVMDDEMAPAREAARVTIRRLGGEPVMWEEMTPRDQRAQDAYLDGVDRSLVFVLLLGKRYGVSDSSGYSPTHQEANRAAERGILRLLWEPAGLSPAERDGRLNDWLRSLYNEVSGGKYTGPEDLDVQLERRLHEIASAQERLWMKLGPLVFPGTVRRRSSGRDLVLEVTTRVRDGALRRALADAARPAHGLRLDRLTWAMDSQPVDRVETEVRSVAASEDEVLLVCQQSGSSWRSGGNPLGGATYTDQTGRRFGPAAQAELWARQALFGEDAAPGGSADLVHVFTAPGGPTLTDVLNRHRAQGWLAEGLVRLYLVEGLIARLGGHLDRLQVGPATASSVRISAAFTPESLRPERASIDGIVPLR